VFVKPRRPRDCGSLNRLLTPDTLTFPLASPCLLLIASGSSTARVFLLLEKRKKLRDTLLLESRSEACLISCHDAGCALFSLGKILVALWETDAIIPHVLLLLPSNKTSLIIVCQTNGNWNHEKTVFVLTSEIWRCQSVWHNLIEHFNVTSWPTAQAPMRSSRVKHRATKARSESS
jgi:hypothetical protein